jgi:adenylate cyclase
MDSQGRKFLANSYRIGLIFFLGGFLVALEPALGGTSKKPSKNSTVSESVIISRVIVEMDTTVFLNLAAGPGESLNDKKIVLPSKFTVLPGRITLEFHYSDPKARYQTYLEKFDNRWSRWASYNRKEYTHLPDGKYVFKVRARDAKGKITDSSILYFEIAAPFYKSWWAFVAYSIALLIAAFFYIKWRNYNFEKERYTLERIIHERTAELEQQKEQSERLLANVLPKDTADELKSTGRATTHKYSMVTVLFSDIQGFTRIAEQMNPETLIDQLDEFFFQFDSVVEKYNIEKIKTIGDAYMCAGGLPIKNRTNPIDVVMAALEMQLYMKELKNTRTDIWDLRIGIHTGEVVAGVIGHKKLSYDIWGDTVNTASRMESSGEAGKVNISGQTHELVKDFFICEYRGKMPVKYKGEIDMYFVKGIRPELSVDLKNLPNKRFLTQLQLLRLLDFEESLVERLVKELPENLYFHTYKHAVHISTQAELLGKACEIADEDMLILRTAALLHDAGFLLGYEHHQKNSIQLAQETLVNFQFQAEEIEKICGLLYDAFELQPSNLLTEILIDASNDYLGHTDFLSQLDALYRETCAYSNVHSEKNWYENFYKRLNQHQFFTETARKLCEVPIEQQLILLKEKISALS